MFLVGVSTMVICSTRQRWTKTRFPCQTLLEVCRDPISAKPQATSFKLRERLLASPSNSKVPITWIIHRWGSFHFPYEIGPGIPTWIGPKSTPGFRVFQVFRREYRRWGTSGCWRLVRLGSLVGESIHIPFSGPTGLPQKPGLSIPALPSSSIDSRWRPSGL